MGLTTKNFRIQNAIEFIESFTEAEPTNYYFFIGRNFPWTDENAPPTEVDTVNSVVYNTPNQIMSMKRITGSDVSQVVPRINWNSGSQYTQYDNIVDVSNSNFYVVTDEFNVYKCLNNGNGANSTVKPTGTSANNLLFTADGYVWKYMYTITPSDAARFVTDTYIPVKTLTADDSSLQWTVQTNAANGALNFVRMTAGGSGYTAVHTANVFSVTNTTVINLPTAGTSSANGFYSNSAIYITAGTGAGQLRRITNYQANSSVRIVTVDQPFSPGLDTTSTYSISPFVRVRGDGTGFVGFANIANGVITNVFVLNPGQDYSNANVSFETSTGTGATARAVISPRGGHGSDPVRELYGTSVMVDVRLQGAESGTFTVANDYRTIGVIANPLLANNAKAQAISYDMTTQLTVTSPSGQFVIDENVRGDNTQFTGSVVEFAGNTTLKLTNVTGNFANGEVIRGLSSNVTATITNVLQPQVRRYSGDVLYFENRRAIPRAADQSEFIKLVVRF